jgi:hypothetical protein
MIVGKALADTAQGASYMNVEIEGEATRVPRLVGVSTVVGSAVYIIASKDFLLVIGAVGGSGALTVAGLQVNGSGYVTGGFDVAGNVSVGGRLDTQDINGRNLFLSAYLQHNGGGVGFFGRAPVSQRQAPYSSDPAVLAPRLWTALRDLGLIADV